MAGTSVFGYAESDSDDELPSGWEERTTLDDRVFYVNHSDKSTQWRHPRTGRRKKLVGELPTGWIRETLESGEAVFRNAAEEKVTYIDPRLPWAIEDKDETSIGPPRQRFDASSKALQVLHGIDMSNKTVLITGANRGIGFETARSFALHGAQVIMACRDMFSAETARTKILKERPSARIHVLACDLASLSSVRHCAHQYVAHQWPLHILVLNAAVFAAPFTLTEDGFELTFQVNHLAHFYLVRLLRDTLIASAPARVVVVSSESHRFAGSFLGSGYRAVNADHFLSDENLSPTVPSNYWYMRAYNVSKLCNVLFAFELDRQLHMSNVRCNAVHPGNMMSTHLARNSYFLRCLFALVRPFTKSAQQGAATSVFAAAAPEMDDVGGQYMNNCWLCTPDAAAADQKLQLGLWRRSEAMLDLAMDRPDNNNIT